MKTNRWRLRRHREGHEDFGWETARGLPGEWDGVDAPSAGE